MKVALLLNPHAGAALKLNGQGTPAEFVRLAREGGLDAEVLECPPDRLCDLPARVARCRATVVVAAGGDGTVSAAAGAVAGTGIALGVIPLGTLNHFARDLGLPADWREALAALGTYAPREVDVGEVNGRVFINNCSIGCYADAVRRRDRLRRNRGYWKWRAMFVACLDVFSEFRRIRLSLDSEGRTIALRTPFLLVSNNRYEGRLLGAPRRPALDAGGMWVYSARARRRLEVIRMMLRSLVAPLDAVAGLDSRAATEFAVSATGHTPPVAADGEILPDVRYPLHFRVRPRALRVLAPASPAR